MSSIRLGAPAPTAILFLLLVAAPCAAAPIAADLSVGAGAAYGPSAGASLEARVAASAEAYGSLLAARVSGDGAATVPLAGAATSLTTGAIAEFSAAAQDLAAVLRLEGGYAYGATYVDGGGERCSTKAALSLGVNGYSLSASLSPRTAWSSGIDGRTEFGAALGLSASAGAFVFKPGADAAWTAWADGSRSLELRPGLGLSWYPGFPFSLSAEAGFRRTWLASGSTVDELPAALAFFGSVGNRVLFKVGAEALWEIDSQAFAAASAEGELSLLIGRLGRGELRLPVGLSWNMDAAKGFALRAGIELAIE